MLYQLSLYALGQPRGATAAVLYPTTAPAARDSVIEIRDPVAGRPQGFVALPPLFKAVAGEVVFGSELAERRTVLPTGET